MQHGHMNVKLKCTERETFKYVAQHLCCDVKIILSSFSTYKHSHSLFSAGYLEQIPDFLLLCADHPTCCPAEFLHRCSQINAE
jgi:hypothetical protein